MIQIRKSDDRGRTEIDWLRSWHSFSFGDYHDPAHMGFRALRVINEDIVRPASGFPSHPHRDMEIITWVLSGGLEHKDSLGNGDVIRHGDAQHMSAGRGVVHSEWNPAQDEPVHLLQIWIQPDRRGDPARWAQKHFAREDRTNRWQLVADPTGSDGALAMGADARMLVSELAPRVRIAYELDPGRGLWLHVARGALTAAGHDLVGGDALALEGDSELEIVARDASEVLIFDLA
jgi:hypothetical protein